MAIMRWLRGAFLFPILFGTAALLALALSMLSSNVNFDEAYNLQTVDSLVDLRTYASYGALESTGPWRFDPHVTTGLPAAVPVAVAWWLTGGSLFSVRVAMIGFLVAYIWGCLKLLRPHATARSLRLQQALVCAPVLIIGFGDLGDFRGELPASGFAIFALVALDRRRFALAGVLAALAGLTKLVMAVLIPLLFIGVLVDSVRHRFRRAAIFACGALGTVALHESFRMVTVGGWREYQISIIELRSFLQRQRIPASASWHSLSLLSERWGSLVELATWGFFIFMLAAVAVVLFTPSGFKRMNVTGASVMPLIVGVALAPIMIAGWAFQSRALYAAQVLPALLIAGPAALTLLLRGLDLRRLTALSIVASGAALAAAVSGAHFDLDPLSDRQRALQGELATMEIGALFSNGWYQNPELQLLLGVPAVAWPTANQVMVVGLLEGFDETGEFVSPGADAPWLASEICGERFLVDDVELCHVRDARLGDEGVPTVVNWGERSVEVGQVPNPQIDGQAGFWVVVEPESRVALSPLRIRIDGRRLRGTEFSSDGSLLTALAPPTLFDDAVELTVDLENLTTGELIPLGTIQVSETP